MATRPDLDRDVKWWTADDPHHKLADMVATVEHNHAYRRQMNLHHMRLFADRDIYGAQGASGTGRYEKRFSAVSLLQQRRPRLSINVTRNMINASVSMLAKGRPRPQFLTNGGDPAMQKKAKRRGEFVEAVFHKEKSYLLGQKMLQLGCILGTGFIKVVRDYDEKRVRHEHAYTGEVLVDETEAVYGNPRNFFHIRPIDKLVLKEMYGNEKAVDGGKVARAPGKSHGAVADQVIVIEAWHLPSGPSAKDGRYAVVTDGGTLYESAYTHQHAPFVKWVWEEDPLGYYGTGIASELTGIQYEINETIRNIQANWWAGGNMKILVERGAKVHKAHLNNDLRGTIVEYTGKPPAWIANEAVAPGLLNYLKYLVEQAYNVTGISQLSAQSQTPAASMSGRARLIADHNESERFLTAQRRYEEVFMALAERTLEAAQDIYEQAGDFEVIHAGKEHLMPIKYSEIASSTGTYEITVHPTSIMPSTPAGKLAMIESLEARGYIDREQAMKLLDFPDLKRELDLEMSWTDLIEDRINKILADGVYIAPHPDMPLDMALEKSLKALALAENREVDEERIDLLRRWRTAVVDQKKRAAQQAAAPPPGMPGAPPTGPGLPGAGGAIPPAAPVAPAVPGPALPNPQAA